MDENNLVQEIETLRREMLELKDSRGFRGFMKRSLTKMNILIGSCIALVISSAVIYAAQIFFSTGTVISSSEVNANFSELYSGMANMKGIIVMWSGAVADIPTGWALCDGTNGTPDLRDRFVVGAGWSYNPADTGGANTVLLGIAQMPNHSHANTLNDPGHRHTFTAGYRENDTTDGDEPGMENTTAYWTDYAVTGITITNAAAGGGGPHENRPPYYALAYIMKK
jgi:microcystin-dependent protein